MEPREHRIFQPINPLTLRNTLNSRGLREPETMAMAEAKRLYVRKTPYLVTGCVGMPFLPMPPVSDARAV